MNITTEVHAHAVIFTLVGKLEPQPADWLQAELDKCIQSGAKSFIFDMSGTDYVGSLGLRVFVAAAKAAPNGVRLVGVKPVVRQVFDLTKVSNFVKFYPTLSDALDAAK